MKAQNKNTNYKSLFLLAAILYFSGVTGYIIWSYRHMEKVVEKNLDNQLFTGVKAVNTILSQDYHDLANEKNAVSYQKYHFITQKLRRFTTESGFVSVYTLTRKNGKIHYTSSSFGTKGVSFFMEYKNPPPAVKKAFDEIAPVFRDAEGRWGTFRSLLVRHRSPSGNIYLVGVDYPTGKMKKDLRSHLMHSIISGVFFIFLSIPVILVYRMTVLRHTRQLEALNRRLKEDISHQMEMEKALRESEKTYRNLFHNAQVGLFRTRGGMIIECNDALARMFGFENRQLCIKSYSLTKGFMDPKARDEMITVLQKTQEIANYEARFRRKDGNAAWIRCSARYNPEKDWVEGVAEDITERKAVFQELYRYQAIFEESADQAPVGIVLVDPQEYPLVLNQSAREILGIKNESLKENETFSRFLTRMGVDIYDTEGKPFPKNAYVIKRAMNKEVLKNTEHKLKRPDGEERWVLTNTAPVVDTDGKLMAVVGTFSDITGQKLVESEKKQLEERVRGLQKMETLGLLAGGVAHDLNNILSGIISYPELILMDMPEEDPMRGPLENIFEAGKRAALVVGDLLTIARGATAPKEVVSLPGIVREYLDSPEYSQLCSIHPGVTIQHHGGTEEISILASPVHIRKTIMNLMNNAAEAITMEGTIEILCEKQTVNTQKEVYGKILPKGEYAVLTIKDTGKEISQKDMEHIFDPFYTKKEMGKSGTGLGLAVVWNTVLDQEGYIEVKSMKKGTAFILYFPLSSNVAEFSCKNNTLESYMGAKEFILVVDDEPGQQEIARRMLTRLNYQVETVSSGKLALSFLKYQETDLVLLDMVMPEMNGFRTYEEILRIRPDQKILIASGYANTQEVQKVMEMGAKGFIQKPYTLEQIGISVRSILNPICDDKTPSGVPVQ